MWENLIQLNTTQATNKSPWAFCIALPAGKNKTSMYGIVKSDLQKIKRQKKKDKKQQQYLCLCFNQVTSVSSQGLSMYLTLLTMRVSGVMQLIWTRVKVPDASILMTFKSQNNDLLCFWTKQQTVLTLTGLWIWCCRGQKQHMCYLVWSWHALQLMLKSSTKLEKKIQN